MASTDKESKEAQGTSGDLEPVKCVVVGGGYSGARTAYQLDSIFHVTLVDTKNYFEATDELNIVLNGPDETVQERLDDLHALHRFYLRRARVVTNTVVDVEEKFVKLADGRRIPYDVLVLTTGQKRPYPFAPTVTTADVREAQIKAYRTLLRRKDVHKIAVVGGGARGCSLAHGLGSACPDKDIHVFHSTGSLCPTFPYESRNRVELMLDTHPCITVHRNRVVTGVDYTNQPSLAAESVRKARSWWPFKRAASEKQSSESSSNAAVESEDVKKQDAAANVDSSSSSSTPGEGTGDGADQQMSRHAKVTVVASGDGVTKEIDYEEQAKASESPYLNAKFKLDVSVREDTRKTVPSVLYQAYFGDTKKFEISRGPEIGTESHDGFDLVINCAGNLSNGRMFEKSSLLAPHLDADGNYIVSNYSQFYGHPNIFGIGRGCNIKWVKSIGASDYQARMLFRNLLSVAQLADSKVTGWIPTMTPVRKDSMSFPRLIVPFDEVQAVGSTAWTGSVVGPVALKELTQDRAYYLKEFHKPIFFKQQDDNKVRNSVDGYFEHAATDPTDFDNLE